MIKTIFVGFLLCVYLSAMVFLYVRYIDVKKNPKKYDTIPGYDEYKKSEWFWEPKKEFTKIDPPGQSDKFGPGIFLFTGLILYVSVNILPDVIAKKNEATIIIGFMWSKWSILPLVIGISFSMFLGFFLPMFSKKPIAISANLHYVFKGRRRSYAWRKMLTLALAFCALMMPLHILSVLNYGYANSERIVYSPFFSFEEQVFEYDDIQNIKVIYSDDNERITQYLIYNSKGECFDVYQGVGTYPEVSEQIIAELVSKCD